MNTYKSTKETILSRSESKLKCYFKVKMQNCLRAEVDSWILHNLSNRIKYKNLKVKYIRQYGE